MNCILCLVAAFVLPSSAVDSALQYTVTDEAWFEVEVRNLKGPGQSYTGRFTVALFGDIAPMTVMNFVALVRGYKRSGQTLHYKNAPVHRIVKDFVIQTGDITTGDGTGGTSIYGEKFNDEEFKISHRAPGVISMANRGRDTNGSQFFITMVKARWMDGKHVAFGKVIRGYDVLRVLNELPTDSQSAWPLTKVKINDCGINSIPAKYDLNEKQIEATDDIDLGA